MPPMLRERTDLIYGDSVGERIGSLSFSKHLSTRTLHKLSSLLHDICLHDADVYLHGFRMAELAERVCRSMDMTQQEQEQTCLAMLLHDIGKLGIASSILRKTTRLNDDEWAKMRRHPEIGAHLLLKQGGIFAQIAPLVLAHHERWDGGGYPFGLAGEAIPLAARLVTVVDAYDVMISCRAYKSSATFDETCTELLRCAGSQFDPHMVRVVLAVLGRSSIVTNVEHAYV